MYNNYAFGNIICAVNMFYGHLDSQSIWPREMAIVRFKEHPRNRLCSTTKRNEAQIGEASIGEKNEIHS